MAASLPIRRLAALVTGLCVPAGLLAGADRGEAAFPGQNGKIAFIRAEQLADARLPQGDLYLMNADGSDQQLLLPRVVDASFSPDGQRLVFLQGTARRNTVSVARADGTGPRRLTAPGIHGVPRFAANGRSVLFGRLETGIRSVLPDLRYAARSTLYEVGVRGGRARPFARVRGAIYGLSPSPSGSRLAVIRAGLPRRGADPAAELFTIRRDGGGWRRLVTASVAFSLTDFSPDGGSLVFANMVVTPANPFGNAAQPSGIDGNTDYGGVWSPDGSLIAFARAIVEPATVQVHVIPAGGGPVTRLTSSTSIDVPVAWQPLP